MDLGVLPTKDEAVRAARLNAYLAAWEGRGADVEQTLKGALPVAAGHHAVSYQRIIDEVGDHTDGNRSSVHSSTGCSPCSETVAPRAVAPGG